MSCTESITLDLNGVQPEIVVEASLPESALATVKLSKTVDFGMLNDFPVVSGALVCLKDQNNLTDTLTEITPGHYVSSWMKGVSGMHYELSIEKDDLVMRSEDLMPKAVKINAVRVRKLEFPPGPIVDNVIESPRTEIIVDYTDPEDEVNFYRFIEIVNGKKVNYFLSDDRFNNGKVVKNFLLDFNRRLHTGDTVVIEMQSISKPVYNYLYGFSMMNVLPQGTTPSNPVTNIDGASLGYFSAFTFHRDTVILPEL
jgi:hypothetical protein